jgi:glycosyltransferase involved in cell wall biosynthesis
VGAIPAQLVDGEDAILFTPGDTAELNEQIRRLRDDPALRALLAASGSAAALHRRSWDRAVEQVIAAIDTVGDAPLTRGRS